MGAIAVSVPMGDIYEGLQRGVVEGVIFPAEALKGWRFGDLIRGLQDNDGLGYPSAQCLVMNKGNGIRCPRIFKKTIEKISEEYIEKQGKLWDETTKEGVEFGISKGMKVFKISPAEVAITRENMKPVLGGLCEKDEGERAARGRVLEVPSGFCQVSLISISVFPSPYPSPQWGEGGEGRRTAHAGHETLCSPRLEINI